MKGPEETSYTSEAPVTPDYSHYAIPEAEVRNFNKAELQSASAGASSRSICQLPLALLVIFLMFPVLL